MKEQKKKRLIALLLLISCFISGYMLFAIPGMSSQQIQSFAQADSLIREELSAFNIEEQQFQISSIRVDSQFTRKIYHIGVPYQFSKTQFHAELNKRFYPYSVKTPAKITFPEKDMDIHLLYQNTVIRSLSLQTDPDLTLNQNRISILVVFENVPGEDLMSRLKSLGEPIPIVLTVENPIQANELRKRIGSQYEHIIFWLQNDQGEDLITADRAKALNKLRQLQEVLPEAVILQYPSPGKISAENKKMLVSNTKIAFVDASNAPILDEQMEKASFLDSLEKLQSRQTHAMAIITGNETTLRWLSQKLAELKKAGAVIVPPVKTNL